MISVLCTELGSNYNYFPGLDLWNINRDAYFFTGSNPVITHAPCAQWSRLKGLAYKNDDEKELAYHCLKYVIRNGGIFEHPNGSSFFREVGIADSDLYTIDQNLFGYPARKTTKLLFVNYKPADYHCLWPVGHRIGVNNISSSQRSSQTIHFTRWLLSCIEYEKYKL